MLYREPKLAGCKLKEGKGKEGRCVAFNWRAAPAPPRRKQNNSQPQDLMILHRQTCITGAAPALRPPAGAPVAGAAVATLVGGVGGTSMSRTRSPHGCQAGPSRGLVRRSDR